MIYVFPQFTIEKNHLNVLFAMTNLDKMVIKWSHIRAVHANFVKKTFSTKSDLKRRLEGIHEKIRPHRCGLCKHRFSYIIGHLKSHVLAVHQKIKLHKCSLCDAYFLEYLKLMIVFLLIYLSIYLCKCHVNLFASFIFVSDK